MTTTKLIKHNIVDEIKAGIDCSSSTAILVSFMMVSGLELILPSLQRSLDKGTQIKILTGDYLYITQPDALSRLDELVGDIELRLWKSHGVSFHPKAYLFESDHEKQVIVGSSNLSKSALTTGVEWNVSIEQQGRQTSLKKLKKVFYSCFMLIKPYQLIERPLNNIDKGMKHTMPNIQALLIDGTAEKPKR